MMNKSKKIIQSRFWIGLVGTLIVAAIIGGLIMWMMPHKPSRALIATGHPEWPPVMFQEGDQIVGAGPDLVRKIFGDLDIDVTTPAVGTWEDAQVQAKAGQVDVLVAAYKTTEREGYMLYSDAYTTDPVVLFVRNDKKFAFNDWSELVGKTGVGTAGDSYGQDFDTYSANNLNLQRVQTSAEAFDLVASGQADYFIYSLYAGNLEIKNKQRTEIVPLDKHVSEQNFYITISKQSPFTIYLDDINRLIKQYQDDGTINQLLGQYQ